MRFPRDKGPPSTTNETAALLIRVAAARCEGCRLSWRLTGWTHGAAPGVVAGFTCKAQEQRQTLRDMAAAQRAASKRWHIRIQRRCAYNGRYGVNDWRAYREWLVWPKTFPTAKAAQRFMDECFTFKGLGNGGKMSASVCECKREASASRGQW